MTDMRIAMACDHGGFLTKQDLTTFLRDRGYTVDDLGTFDENAVDYPDLAAAVARKVSAGEVEGGVLLCGTGIGMSIVANKFPGVRAALVSNTFSARMAKEHNDANVLSLGERMMSIHEAMEIVELWLGTPFSGDKRHVRRIEKIENKS